MLTMMTLAYDDDKGTGDDDASLTYRGITQGGVAAERMLTSAACVLVVLTLTLTFVSITIDKDGVKACEDGGQEVQQTTQTSPSSVSKDPNTSSFIDRPFQYPDHPRDSTPTPRESVYTSTTINSPSAHQTSGDEPGVDTALEQSDQRPGNGPGTYGHFTASTDALDDLHNLVLHQLNADVNHTNNASSDSSSRPGDINLLNCETLTSAENDAITGAAAAEADVLEDPSDCQWPPDVANLFLEAVQFAVICFVISLTLCVFDRCMFYSRRLQACRRMSAGPPQQLARRNRLGVRRGWFVDQLCYSVFKLLAIALALTNLEYCRALLVSNFAPPFVVTCLFFINRRHI